MKKKFTALLILFIFPLALLTGCGKEKRPSLDDRIGDTEATSYEGIVESLEALDVYQQGTHQLVTDDSGVIIIQSPTINLNQYLDEEVRVKGTMVRGVGDADDVFTVREIAYIDESKQAQQQYYENKLFGFKFSYPGTWKLDEGTSDLGLQYEEKELVSIAVFPDQNDLDAFAASREEGESTEVTIGAQRALRFVVGQQIGFYVPNPPKKKIYLIKYLDSDEAQLEHFYKLLDSFELIYMGQVSGEKCGGLQQIECPEEQICQLDSDGKYAEGVCVPMNGEDSQANCPYIAPPSSCNHYRISEYSLRGCPTRYECVSESEGDAEASYRDLNTVDAGVMPDDYEAPEESDEEGTDVNEDKEDAEMSYDVPDTSDVTTLYSNDRAGFSLLMPRTWYFASFGSVGGEWTVGFADFGLEETEEAIITLTVTDKAGGRAYKKVGDDYYVFDGPEDLTAVMEKMADSVKESE